MTMTSRAEFDDVDDLDEEDTQHDDRKMGTQSGQQGKVAGSREHWLSEGLHDEGD
jgi:hypothetical protein